MKSNLIEDNVDNNILYIRSELAEIMIRKKYNSVEAKKMKDNITKLFLHGTQEDRSLYSNAYFKKLI